MNPDARFQMGFAELYTAAQIAKMVAEISDCFANNGYPRAKVYPTQSGISVAFPVSNGVGTIEFLTYTIKSVGILFFPLSPNAVGTQNFVINYYPK